MRRNFHKNPFAVCLYHTVEQALELDGLGSGEIRRQTLAVDHVLHRTYETGFVSERDGYPVQKSSGRGLAVGTGHAHYFKIFRRIAENMPDREPGLYVFIGPPASQKIF